MAVLGIEHHEWWGLPDGGLGAVPAADGAARVAELVDRVRPDTIVTFGADGVTGHGDHCAVAAWVEAAVTAMPVGARPRVLLAALERGYCARFARLHDELGVFMTADSPVPLGIDELDVHLELADADLDRKVVALRAMASQTDAVVAAMGDGTYRSWVAVESFVEAPWGGGPQACRGGG